MVAYIFLAVFAVTINFGLFSPTPLDDLTINLNLNESPKEYEEDDFNNNDYQAPEVYQPTITNNYFFVITCTITGKNGNTRKSKDIQPNEKWTSPEPVNWATTQVLCISTGSSNQCDGFLNFDGTTNPDWVVIASSGLYLCKVEKEPTPYKPTILNSYTEKVSCSVILQDGEILEFTDLSPSQKWMSPEPVNRLTIRVWCEIAGGGCDPVWITLYGTTNPDWVVIPNDPTSQRPCKVETAPISYTPTITNKYDQQVTCHVTLMGGEILHSTPLSPNQKWTSTKPVNEDTFTVQCLYTSGGARCEHFRDDRGTKNADWVVNESHIEYPCKVEKVPIDEK